MFAQLLGTLMLLEEDERARVKGLIVNKFRGDKTILDPGLDILRERSGVPIAGVVPYTLVDIDDEDSMSDRLSVRSTGAAVDIAVIRLPKVSNFTDFIALSAIEGIGVRYVQRPSEMGEPDLVILPGTKNTIADLKWLRESGIEAVLLKRAAAGTPIVGICGGYQMLGLEVSDPHNVEGGGSIRGVGLLPTRTVFEPAKRQVRVATNIGSLEGPLAALSGVPVEGYEIHMGTTTMEGEPVTAPVVGVGNVYGTYIHGIFDTRECAEALAGALFEAKGLDAAAVQAYDMKAYKEEQYDKLARAMRDNMDMELIYRILEEGA